MAPIFLPDLRLNAELSGPQGGPPLVMLHALGLDLGIWDGLVAALPRHRILRLDMRGHGGSDVPPAPYTMGSLIRDTERAMDHHGMAEAVVIGLSIGGLIAQGLAVKRLDLVRGLVLSNTAARIGIAGQWQDRIAAVQAGWAATGGKARPCRRCRRGSCQPIRKAGWAAPQPSPAPISMKPPPPCACPRCSSPGAMTDRPRPI